MTTTATLESTSLSLDPGDEAVVPLHIRNNGDIVEAYDLSVVGEPGSWATVEPAQVTLYPGTTTSATVTFRPPRSARAVAGSHEFGVMVRPTERPEESVVPEGVVEVLPYFETTAELVPRTSQGRKGRHQVAIDNRGNVPVNVFIEAGSDGERLTFKQGDQGLTIAPGEARFTSITAKARKRIWRGQPVTHPFVVDVRPENGSPVVLEGTYVQTPMIPKWLIWLLLALIALILLLAAIWFWLLKPTIESQAREAAEEAAAEAAESAERAEQGAQAAQGAAGAAQQAANEAEDVAGQPKPARTLVLNESHRLSVQTASSGGDAQPFGADTTFEVTDVVLSNPQGDLGRVQLLVDGEIQLDVALENFRDLDFHWVTPIVAADSVALDVTCRTPGAPIDVAPAPTECDISALVGGESIKILAE